MEIPERISGRTPEISILLSSSHGKMYKYFRCSSCGKIVFGYTNDSIRMIVPDGHPVTERPSKRVKCTNKLNLGDPQIMLHEVIASVFATDDINDTRAIINKLATLYNETENKGVQCNAVYYVS